MTNDNVWVLAYNKTTNERVGFTYCARSNANFYERKYQMDGYRTAVFETDEVDEITGYSASEHNN